MSLFRLKVEHFMNAMKLKFIDENLSIELKERLLKSRAKLTKSQRLSLLLLLVPVLAMFFPGTLELKFGYYLLATAFFLIPFTIWIIICSYTFGNDWRKFEKWYSKWQMHKVTIEDLYQLYESEESMK